MKIINIVLTGVYTEGFSYQENLLPKYQKQIGNEIKIIANESKYDLIGKVSTQKNTDNCKNEHGIQVVRLRQKKGSFYRIKRYLNIEKEIENFSPDIIFVHGIQFLDMLKIIRYKKNHPNVKLYVDNHADLNNSAKNFLSRNILHGIIWKSLAKKSIPYVEKYYGVTPARVDFLTDVYKLPKNKVELLPLGADDEIVAKATQPQIRDKKRKDYGLFESDFIIITGGKIDHNKPQTIAFMEAVNRLEVPNVRLLVFGSVSDDLKSAFDEQLSDKVKYIGWKKSEEIYYEFAAADLVVFPGLHSVLWEQAVGMGKPCIFKDIKGFHHIDLGGNCLFFENDSVEEYVAKIMQAKANLDSMRDVAEESGMKHFSYKEIAKKSIEM